MYPISRRSVLLGTVFALLAVRNAEATPLTFHVTGLVDSVTTSDPSVLDFDGSIVIGISFSATFTLDLESLDLNSAPDRGLYPLLDYSASLGAYRLAGAGDGQIVVTNDIVGTRPDNRFDIFTIDDPSPLIDGSALIHGSPQSVKDSPMLDTSVLLFSQFDFDASFLQSDALILPDLDSVPATFNLVFSVGTVHAVASGGIRNLVIVPEPSTAVLLACGIALCRLACRAPESGIHKA